MVRIFLYHSSANRFDRNYRSPAGFHLMRPALETCRGSGIWTGFPSTTTFVLALGADLPWADCLYPGNLRFSADGDPTRLFVTYTCILSSSTSRIPHGYSFISIRNAPLPPMLAHRSKASVYRLAPLHYLRAGARPVSYYALFQGMAASKPTSWLSLHLHLILHLAVFRDLSCWSGLFPSRLRTLSHAVSLPCVESRHSEFDWGR